MSTTPAPTTDRRAPAPMFPAAGACAELLLAHSKDEVYEGELKSLLREVLERCCGAHLLSQLLPELSAIAGALYYLLALGRTHPMQTLGEEFCDIMRVTTETVAMNSSRSSGGSNAAAAAVERVVHITRSRQLLWLALALLPSYIAARSQSGWRNLVQLTRSPRERMEQQLRERQANARRAAAASASTTSDSAVAITTPNGTAAERSLALAQLTPQRALQAIDRLVARLKALATHMESNVFPASYAFSLTRVRTWASQLHLAGFYIFAKYLHVATRMSKTQYVFVRSDLAPAINLSLLGYMMALRLFVTAGVETKRLQRHYVQDNKHKLGGAGQDATQAAGHSDRVPTASSGANPFHVVPGATASSSSRRSGGNATRKCALCLGDRIAPAVTPCGHVFCWECIVGWCQKNKAECPLCRQETHPQQITCLYNYA